MPGHGWYLLWLLLFNWIYVQTNEYRDKNEQQHDDDDDSSKCTPFPSTIKRVTYGVIICGIIMCGICALTPNTFASMPIANGSLSCHMFMFTAGIIAKHNKWMEQPILHEQMDIKLCTLLLFILVEIIGTCVCLPKVVLPYNTSFYVYAAIGFICSGMYCLDMCLFILAIFQKYANFENRITKFFATSSYTVFLIHPVIVCILSASFVWIYNYSILLSLSNTDHNSTTALDDLIVFDTFNENTPFVPPPYKGKGGDYFPIAWILVNIMSQLLVWPLSYLIKTKIHPTLTNIL